MFRVSTEVPFGAFYKLGITDEGRTILFNMPQEIWEKTQEIIRSHKRRTIFPQQLRIPDFIFPGALPWGFGSTFIDGPSSLFDWHCVICELPCFMNSDGTARDDAWERGCAVVASLQFLIWCLEAAHNETLVKEYPSQSTEVMVSVRSEDGRRYYGIAAGLSSPHCQWLVYPNHDEEMRTVSQAMNNAHCRMEGIQQIHRFDFCGSEIRPNCSLSFSVPGDRAGMGTYTNSRGPFGINLSDHNVDTPIQLLTLLVGLAAFDEIASKG